MALCVASATGQHKAGDLKIKPYVFENGKGEKVDAELGVLLVPENRSDPQSNLIELAFVRFKSTAKNPAPPIVYLAGGPGGSGIGTAKGSRFPLFMALREVGDVIAFDQRGTGMSKPDLTCFERFDLPLDVVPAREAVVRAMRERAADCAWYWHDLQRVDLTGYNTNESADDLEDLRKALGVKQISLWSISYGTHLSLATIRRHPQSIHRAILAGTEGPDHTYKLPSNIQKHLEDLAAVIKADPELGKDIPDFLGLMKSVFDRLDKEPAIVEITDPRTKQQVKVTVNKFVMQYIAANNIGTTVAASYPTLFYRASKGDFTNPAQVWFNISREGIGSAMSYMMDCASGLTAARRERIQREAKDTLLEDLSNYPFPDICEEWKAPDLGDTFRSLVRSDVPVLFISGTLDARTPISNAEEYRAGFPNSTHLIIEGAVHSDPLFLSSPKIKDVMLEFMKGLPVSTTRIMLPPMKFVPLSKSGLTGSQPSSTTNQGDLEAKVDTYIKPYLEMGSYNGAVLIAKGGKVLVSKGYGMANYELGVPNTPQSRFHLASVSKPFTAAAILILQERGKLSVNDPLSKYVPDFPSGDKITLHQLLSHTAGLAGDLPNFQDWTAPITLEKLVALVKKAPPVGAPGAKYSYSNNDYRLLAYIIEKVSGQSYGDFLKAAIFDPLDMKDTGHEGATGSLVKNRAYGYKPVGLTDLENIYIDWSTKTGNGSLYSTVEDLYKWDRALYTEKILKKSSLETMFKEKYGWFVSEQFKRKLIRYGGRSPGFNSDFQRFINDDVCVVVLSNNYSATANPIANDLAAMIFNEPYAVPEVTAAISVDNKELDRYVGRYEGGPDFFIPKAILTIERKGDQLWMNYSTGADTTLVPLSATKFLTRPFWATITFVKDEKGNVTHLIYGYSGTDYIARAMKDK